MATARARAGEDAELVHQPPDPLPDSAPVIDRVAALIVQVRGMQNVTPERVAEHIASVLAAFGRSTDDTALIAEALRFREYWNAKRASYPVNRAWRSQDWHRAITNWFTRYAERSVPTPGGGYDVPRPRLRPNAGGTTVDRSLENLRAVMAALGREGER